MSADCVPALRFGVVGRVIDLWRQPKRELRILPIMPYGSRYRHATAAIPTDDGLFGSVMIRMKGVNGGG